MGIIEDRFVENTLRKDTSRFEKNHGLVISNRFYSSDRGQTYNLLNNRRFLSDNVKMSFAYPAYLRFNDIARKVVVSGKGIVQKKHHVYNRFVYGVYFSIAKELMYGITEDVIAEIKGDVNNG